MPDNFGRQFGLFIAYLLPGFIGLAGLAPLAPAVTVWLLPENSASPGVASPLYALTAAATVGMILSCFRWALIDFIHQKTGVRPPDWDDSRLDQRLDAFAYLVENHYRYYQFYANMVIALLWAYPVHRLLQTSKLLGLGTDLGVFITCAVLFAGSRDALAKYYVRTSRLIGQVAEKGSSVMTNGNHVAETAGTSQEPRKQPVAEAKPQTGVKAEPLKTKDGSRK